MTSRIHRTTHPRYALWLAFAVSLIVCSLSGCTQIAEWHQHISQHFHDPEKHPLLAAHHQPPPQLPNPIFVGVTDPDFVWDQVVDSVDDHFKIEREERVKLVGGVVTEGRLTTFPTVGSTYLEPWRRDSTHGFERLHSSLQSIRRYAFMRVTPAPGGYYVEAIVSKELEDLFQPENAPVGGSALRHDGSVVRSEGRLRGEPTTLGWIPQGRDVSLEQRLLADIQSRLGSLSVTE